MLPKKWIIESPDNPKPLFIQYIQTIDSEFDQLKNEQQFNAFLGQQKQLLNNLLILIEHLMQIKEVENNELARYSMKKQIQNGRDLEKKILIMIIKVRKKLKIFDDDQNELTNFLNSKIEAKRAKDEELAKQKAKKVQFRKK